jgi:hypothetical protein
MDMIIGILFEFGLGIIALLILVSSALHPKNVRNVLIRGMVAAIFLGLQCILSIFLVSAFSQIAGPEVTRRGEAITGIVILISAFSLAVYFPVAIARAKHSIK